METIEGLINLDGLRLGAIFDDPEQDDDFSGAINDVDGKRVRIIIQEI